MFIHQLECIGELQEFVRDGFDWDVWEKNILRMYHSENVNSVHIMMTISNTISLEC